MNYLKNPGNFINPNMKIGDLVINTREEHRSWPHSVFKVWFIGQDYFICEECNGASSPITDYKRNFKLANFTQYSKLLAS